jgi:hypothetical protein
VRRRPLRRGAVCSEPAVLGSAAPDGEQAEQEAALAMCCACGAACRSGGACASCFASSTSPARVPFPHRSAAASSSLSVQRAGVLCQEHSPCRARRAPRRREPRRAPCARSARPAALPALARRRPPIRLALMLPRRSRSRHGPLPHLLHPSARSRRGFRTPSTVPPRLHVLPVLEAAEPPVPGRLRRALPIARGHRQLRCRRHLTRTRTPRRAPCRRRSAS